MSLLRNQSLNQLKRINDEIKKQGGTTERTSDTEKQFANNLYMHNPIDAHKSGKRKIATAEEFFKNDIPDASVNVKMKNENILNESAIKHEIETAIENWYNGDDSSVDYLSELIGLDEQDIINILNNSDKETAMNNLMIDEPIQEFKSFDLETLNENESKNLYKYLEFKFSKNHKRNTK